MTPRLWPRSLAGQMALLIALALFVAQAINFGLFLRERHAFRLEQVTGPAVTRFVDATERMTQGRGPVADRGRVRRVPANPMAAGKLREPEVESAIRTALTDAGVKPGIVAAGVQPLDPDDPMLRRFRRGGRIDRLPRDIDQIVIAVQLPDHSWLVQRSLWPVADRGIVWRLVAQTLILYVIVLLPVLWIARRISRPLRDLTRAAERFRPGDDAPPLPEQGPRDIAALVAAFNRLRLRVTAMLDEKDRMLGAIGHDLRTPLAALRVRIESVEDDADRERMVETVADMNRTLDDILSLARLGRPSEPLTDVDLAALVDAVVEDYRDLDQPVTFIEAPRLPIRMRPSLMRRAIRNLIENAVKYGASAAVRIEALPDRIAIVVADQGPGIPTDRMAAVFDPFTRLETSRNRDTGGIGLGLALARAIVRDAGGDITLANAASGGLEATISLPR